jgi:hypothetical protein
MLMTEATTATHRPQGHVVARKFAAAALVIFLGFAGFFATAQRAGADTGIPASGATGAIAGSATGVPPGSTVEPPQVAGNGTPEAPVDLAQPAAQDAATAQAATAGAAAALPQQSNAIGATRADSSGDESASQQNDVSVVGAAANAASTSQTAGSGPPPADGAPAEGEQQAATDQAANAAAAAVQPQQSNVVIIVRINSPGDDVISQTNVVSVVAVAANQSGITQNPAPAVVAAPGTTDPSQSPSGASSTPSTDGQPAQTGSHPAQAPSAQPQQPADAVQQLHRQPVRALSILAFPAGSTANLPAPEQQATSPTTSTSRPRSEGAASRSGVFGPNTGAVEGSDRASVDSKGSSIQTARPQADRTGAQGSRDTALGAVRDHVASWLGQTGAATRPQIAAESARGLDLGLLTLTALFVGLLAWAALSLPPFLRR